MTNAKKWKEEYDRLRRKYCDEGIYPSLSDSRALRIVALMNLELKKKGQ